MFFEVVAGNAAGRQAKEILLCQKGTEYGLFHIFYPFCQLGDFAGGGFYPYLSPGSHKKPNNKTMLS